MNYKIAVASERDNSDSAVKQLEGKVYRLMLEGYKPQGGVSIAAEIHGYHTYYTACKQ